MIPFKKVKILRSNHGTWIITLVLWLHTSHDRRSESNPMDPNTLVSLFVLSWTTKLWPNWRGYSEMSMLSSEHGKFLRFTETVLDFRHVFSIGIQESQGSKYQINSNHKTLCWEVPHEQKHQSNELKLKLNILEYVYLGMLCRLLGMSTTLTWKPPDGHCCSIGMDSSLTLTFKKEATITGAHGDHTSSEYEWKKNKVVFDWQVPKTNFMPFQNGCFQK